MATAEFVNQAQKGIKKSFDTGAMNDVNKYLNLPFLNVQTNDEWASIFTTTEGFSGAKKLTEHEAPPVNSLGDGYSITTTKNRYGVGYEITEDDMQKMGDSSTKVDLFLTRKRNRALRNVQLLFSTEVYKFFNYAFATTYYAAPDDAALCATHTWNTTETFANNGTAAFDEDALKDALEAISQITDPDGEEMQVNPNAILVRKNSPAEWAARALLAENITPTSVGDVNVFQGSMTIYAVPGITYANQNYWFVMDTRQVDENPLYVGVGKYPALTEPKIQNNEAILQNITGYWMQGIVNMPYMIYGSTGTT